MIALLRLGHRKERDKRITTHLGLVARAFGVSKLILTTRDIQIKKSVENVAAKFGGNFKVEFYNNWKTYIAKWKGIKVHLTMYGININYAMRKIPKDKDILIIVGAEKVPRVLYELADYNIAVGNQPHSEVSALSIFLDRFFKGKELEKEFNGKMKIIPCERGKKVIVKENY